MLVTSKSRASHRLALAAAAATLLLANVCWAQQAAPPTPTIMVSTLRSPVDKSYRKMVRGMDLFEKLHALAPGATLRFKLRPRLLGTQMDGITLKIVGDTLTIPVALAADNTFALGRNALALAEDAAVMTNRKVDSMTWRTDIRSPGLPPGTRRLGDLRLECKVGVEAGLVSQGLPVIGQIASVIGALLPACDSPNENYFFFTDRPLFNVTLVHGQRRVSLPLDRLYAGFSEDPIDKSNLKYFDVEVLLDRSYYAPLGDPSWPDDTLLEFEYMDDAPASAAGSKP
jgi:hypothetical protein